MKIRIQIPINQTDKTVLELMMKHHSIVHEISGEFFTVKERLNDRDGFHDLLEYLKLNNINWIEK